MEIMAQLADDHAWQEVMALVDVARMDPRAWPDVRDPGSVQEIREAFGAVSASRSDAPAIRSSRPRASSPTP